MNMKLNPTLMTLLLVVDMHLYSAATIVHENLNSRALDAQLIDAAKSGDKIKVENLIAAGVDVNATDQYRDTALLWATRLGYKEVVQLLISAKANIDAIGISEETALISAAFHGEKEMAQLLIKAKANLDAVNIHGKTALIYAVSWGYIDIVQLLLDAGCDIYKCNEEDKNKKAIDYAREICSFNSEDGIKNKTQIVKLLEFEPERRKEAQIRRVNISKRLHESKALPLVLTLLIDSYLPKDMSDLLSDYEACKNDKDLKNQLINSAATIQDEVQNNLDLNLHYQIMSLNKDDESQIEKLIKSGANVNAIYNTYKTTPLMAAATRGYKNICQLLIDNNADINAADSRGETALMRACFNGYTEIVELLLKSGAEIEPKSESEDKKAIDYACMKITSQPKAEETIEEIVEMLEAEPKRREDAVNAWLKKGSLPITKKISISSNLPSDIANIIGQYIVGYTDLTLTERLAS